MFTGFPEETIQFFLGLRFNNQLSYFNEHRDDYLRQVQAPFYAFIQAMAPYMQKIDPNMEIRPAKCLSRIRRDTRFTKDKSPYRDHLWLLFKRAAEPKDQSVMYWFELGPDSLDWGLGFWGENRPAMDALKRQMVAKPKQFLTMIKKCNLEAHNLALDGDDFKRIQVPESLPEALAPWYRKKQLYVRRQGATLPMAYSADIVETVAADFAALSPLYEVMRGAVVEYTQTLDGEQKGMEA